MKILRKILLKLSYRSRFFVKFLDETGQERFYIAMLRAQLAFFGQDTSHMSDEDIKKGTLEAGRLIAITGVTCEEVHQSLSLFYQ